MASTPAFSLAGIEAQVAMRREQEASAVAYTGTWSTWTDPALSGGSYTYANATGASVTTTIVGSGFALVARTGPEFGRARIYVDGVAEDIDLYSPSTRYQQVVLRKTLAYGTHTVKVEWTGTKNPASSGTYIGIDAIDVITGAPAGSAPTQTLSFDAANRVVGFTYDARGNVLSDGTYTYTWDAYNRLTGVKLASSGALVASFAYDSDGMRQTATAGGVTTRFAVDAVSDEITALMSATGVVVAQFIRDAAGALVAMVRSGAVFTYLTNAHGDVTALLDSAGTVVARWTYDAWGRPTEYNAAGTQVATGTAGNPFLYAGYFFDTATGLYYLRARYYDPATGRFLSMDPEPGRMSDRLSQNPYIYCQNDPVNLADPTGHATVAGDGGGRLTAWQKVQMAALRAKKAAKKTVTRIANKGIGGVRVRDWVAGFGETLRQSGKLRLKVTIGPVEQIKHTFSPEARAYDRLMVSDRPLAEKAKAAWGEFKGSLGRSMLIGVSLWEGPLPLSEQGTMACETYAGWALDQQREGKSPLAAWVGQGLTALWSTESAGKTAAVLSVAWGADKFIQSRGWGSGDVFGKAGPQAVEPQIRKNYRQGVAGEAQTVADLEAAGGENLGRQITLEYNGVRCRADHLFRLPDGTLTFAETKTGLTAGLTRNQTVVYNAIRAGETVTPYGANAFSAGLAPGVPLPPEYMNIWTVHQPWPLF